MKQHPSAPLSRRAHVEPLETRIAPAFTVSLVAATGLAAFVSDTSDDSLTLSVNASGFLTHSLFPTDPSYESATDLDPATGIQQRLLTELPAIDIASNPVGNHDVTLGDAQASWSFGATNADMHSSGGGADTGRISLTINNAANTGGEVLTFATGQVFGGGGGAGKVSFQDLHFIKFIGGSGKDEIEIDASTAELAIDGGGGNDHFHVALGTLTQKVAIADSAGTEDDLEVEGTDQADEITIDESGVHRASELISFSPASGLEKFSLDGGSGGDTLKIVKIPFLDASVAGGAGDDRIELLKHNTLRVDGGEDSDGIYIKFDQADVSAKVVVQDTGAAGIDFIKFEGSALADDISRIKGEVAIHKHDSDASAGIYIKFDGIEGEIIRGGDGGDRFVIKGESNDLTLDGEAGDDEYVIKFDGSEQHITLEPSPGGTGVPEMDSLTVLGTDRADSIAFHKGEIDGGINGYIKFDGLEGECAAFIKIDGVKGDDRFFVDGDDSSGGTRVPAHLTVLGGFGNDTTTIVSAPGDFSVDGGSGSDTVIVELAPLTGSGNLTDSGGSGTDRLFIVGSARDDSYKMDGSDPAGVLIGLSQASNALQFIKFESFRIDAGAGDDTMEFFHLKMSGLKGYFAGGFGNDHVTLRGDHEAGSLTLDGGENGDDYVWEAGGIKGLIRIADTGSGEDGVDDGVDTFSVIGTAQKDTIKMDGATASVGDARLSHIKMDFLKIDAAEGDDLITIKGGKGDCDDLEVNGGGGNDTITNFIKFSAAPPNDYASMLLPPVQKLALEGAEFGGGPHVRILGGADNDILIGSAGDEAFDGGAGDDTIKAGGGNDRITGGTGTNSVDGGGGNDTIIEGADTDFTYIKGQHTADHKGELNFDGVDRLVGVEAFEVIGGDAGHKFDFSEFTGRVVATGGAGDDEFTGGTGNDTFTGGLGSDKFNGGAGYNEVSEQGNVDFTVIGDGKAGTLAGLGADTLTSIALITLAGGDSANLLDGIKWGGDLILAGGGDDDHLSGGTGANTFLGGDGNDTIAGQGTKNLLVEAGDVDFLLSPTALTGRGADVLSGITAAILAGGESDNVIDAGLFTGAVKLVGLAGDDHLTGGTGSTVLDGGLGDDVLTGFPKVTKFIGGPGKNTIIKRTPI